MNSMKWILLTAVFTLPGMAQADEPTNEELDAAWTAEDAAREAAQRVPAAPSSVSKDPLGDITAKADLIIRGIVQSQSFVYDADGIPFTETTFAVSEVLKGDVSGDLFTLVQEGGVEKDSDIVMTSSNSRHFNIGEEELLLLGAENGSGSGVSRGAAFDSDTSVRSGIRPVQIRFRIYGGQAYDEDGRGVFVEALSGGHRLALSGDRNPAALFSEIRIGSHTFTKRISDSSGGNEGDGPAGRDRPERAATPSYTDGAAVGTLIAAINN